MVLCEEEMLSPAINLFAIALTMKRTAVARILAGKKLETIPANEKISDK
jgi:hypothetical protein